MGFPSPPVPRRIVARGPSERGRSEVRHEVVDVRTVRRVEDAPVPRRRRGVDAHLLEVRRPLERFRLPPMVDRPRDPHPADLVHLVSEVGEVPLPRRDNLRQVLRPRTDLEVDPEAGPPDRHALWRRRRVERVPVPVLEHEPSAATPLRMEVPVVDEQRIVHRGAVVPPRGRHPRAVDRAPRPHEVVLAVVPSVAVDDQAAAVPRPPQDDHLFRPCRVRGVAEEEDEPPPPPGPMGELVRRVRVEHVFPRHAAAYRPDDLRVPGEALFYVSPGPPDEWRSATASPRSRSSALYPAAATSPTGPAPRRRTRARSPACPCTAGPG